jgi:hypothetical protein
MGPLELVKLTSLMQRTSGRAEIKVALIDGPVAMDHPDLAGQDVREVAGRYSASCSNAGSAACLHGTFVGDVVRKARFDRSRYLS